MTGSGTGGGSIGGGGASTWPRSKARFASACRVSGSFGWKSLAATPPISPCASTVRICGPAQFGMGGDAAEAVPAGTSTTSAATAPRRSPTLTSSTPEAAHFSVVPVELEIRPEPDERERQAILAALAAEEAERSVDSPWARALRPVPGDDETLDRG